MADAAPHASRQSHDARVAAIAMGMHTTSLETGQKLGVRTVEELKEESVAFSARPNAPCPCAMVWIPME